MRGGVVICGWIVILTRVREHDKEAEKRECNRVVGIVNVM